MLVYAGIITGKLGHAYGVMYRSSLHIVPYKVPRSQKIVCWPTGLTSPGTQTRLLCRITTMLAKESTSQTPVILKDYGDWWTHYIISGTFSGSVHLKRHQSVAHLIWVYIQRRLFILALKEVAKVTCITSDCVTLTSDWLRGHALSFPMLGEGTSKDLILVGTAVGR